MALLYGVGTPRTVRDESVDDGWVDVDARLVGVLDAVVESGVSSLTGDGLPLEWVIDVELAVRLEVVGGGDGFPVIDALCCSDSNFLFMAARSLASSVGSGCSADTSLRPKSTSSW